MPVINGDNGPNVLNDTAGDDTVNGLDGDDTITITNGNDSASGGNDFDTLILAYGDTTTDVTGSVTNFNVAASLTRGLSHSGFERFLVTTGSGNDALFASGASAGNDVFNLGGGNDQAYGGIGDDTLNGEGGDDWIDVGTGDDTADGGSGTDQIGADLQAAASAIVWNLQTNSYSGPIGSFTNFEYFNSVSTGSGNDTIVTGTGDLDDGVFLAGGDDSVTVVNGNDNVIGGDGSDTLVVAYGNATTDITGGASSFIVAATPTRGVAHSAFERFVVTTGSGNDLLFAFGGNDGNDVFNLGAGNDQAFGGGGNDSLNGGLGADAMSGGLGDDIFFVDNAGDTVTEAAGEGTADRIFASVSYVLGAGSEVDRLTTIDNLATTAINLTGNALLQLIYGNAGANRLDSGGGGDVLYGLEGDDTYFVRSVADRVTEWAAGGFDRVFAAVSFTLGSGSHVEKITTIDNLATTAINLTGNTLAQQLWGNAGANTLDGAGGGDQLIGLGGDDQYYIRNAADTVTEGAGGGNDRVFAAVSWTLGAGQQVEKITTIDNAATTAINLTGNALAQQLWGNAGANLLDGRGGGDQLLGLGGDDQYYIRNAADTVTEGAGGGNDRVFAAVSWTLGAGQQVEKITTIDNAATTAINLTGNALAQQLWGNAGANTLDGKGGNDTLVGLGGADTFAFTTALGAGNVDVISGFQVGVDEIALDDAIFTGLAPGALPAGAVRTGTAAVDADDRIIYNSATGALLFDVDGVGGTAAVQFATLSPGLALGAGDFTVI